MTLAFRLTLSLILALTILGYAEKSESKCAFAIIRVSGKVIDEQTKKPVDGAQVVGFIDGDGIHFSKDNRSGSVSLKTSADGEYGGEFLFNRYSGLKFFILPDACDKTPNKLELIIIKEGYLPMKKKFGVKKPTQTVNKQRPPYDYVISDTEIGLIPLNPTCQEPANKYDIQPAPPALK